MVCRGCGVEFLLGSNHERFFCTRKCKNDFHSRKNRGKQYNRHLHVCATCGVEFYSNYKRAVFCSEQCNHNFNIFIIDGIVHKKCTKCGDIKVREGNFYKGEGYSTRDGYNVKCVQCESAWFKTPEGRASHKKSKDARKEKEKIEMAEWRRRPEVMARKNQKELDRKKADPGFNLRCRMRILMYASLRAVKGGRRWQKLAGYSVGELRVHLEKLFTEGMSWELFMQGKIHIDHKIPISKFNYSSPADDDFKKCWSLDNLQPLWAIDNMKKGSKIL